MSDLFFKGKKRVLVKGNGRIDWRKYTVTVDLCDLKKCNTCGVQVWVAETAKGKKIPIEYSKERDGYVSHYDNC